MISPAAASVAKMKTSLEECWHCAQALLRLILAAIRLELKEQGGLPLCPMLSFLDLHGNQIAAEAKLIFRAAWSVEPLNLLLGEAGG